MHSIFENIKRREFKQTIFGSLQEKNDAHKTKVKQ